MPDYQHSCFISYKHPPTPDSLEATKHFWLEFVEAFERKVNTYRQVALLTYRDVSLRSMGGVDYPAELARNLCRSVCMIAILTHEYMKEPWCRGEWRAMEQLEKARKIDRKDTGCIIPVLFRGEPEKAREFCGTRQFLDFRGIIRPNIQLDTVESRQRVEAIGAHVAKLARLVSPVDCSNFRIDVGEEVAELTFDDPNPLV